MNPPLPDRRTLTRFHLDQLSEAEREALEERLLAEAEAFEQAAIAEEELLDDGAAGVLDRRTRAALAATLAAQPDRRRRLALARSLLAAARAAHERRGHGRWARWAAWFTLPRLATGASLAAAGVAAVLAIGFAQQSRQLGLEADRLAERERAANQAAERAAGETAVRRAEAGRLAADLDAERRRAAQLEARLRERPAPAAPAPRAAAFLSLATVVRSQSAVPTLVLPAGATLARIEVDLGGQEPYPAFRATLLGPDGRELWRATGLPAEAAGATSLLEFPVPAALLAPGRHELQVEGLAGPASEGEGELLALHEFRVTAGS